MIDASRTRSEQRGWTGDVATLRSRLRHVYWIGGGSGAGKSTIARRIADRHGLHLYATDDVMSDHASRCTPENGTLLSEFQAMDMDQRWVNRSPETMLETFHWFRGEGFGLIVEDLLRLPREPGVIVEGFRTVATPGEAAPRHVKPGRLAPADSRVPPDRDRKQGLDMGHRREDQ